MEVEGKRRRLGEERDGEVGLVSGVKER